MPGLLRKVCRAELVRRGATAAVLRLLQRGLRSADAVSATPTGRQLHPEDLKTLLELLQSLTGDAGAGASAEVRQHMLAEGMYKLVMLHWGG